MMQTEVGTKRLSPLHSRHQTLGAPFNVRGGWLVPEFYTTPEEEAKALRECAGLADISAWGKLTLKGAQASAVVSSGLGQVPSKPGDITESNSEHTLIARLTPDEFLVLTQPGVESEISASLQAEIGSQGIFASLIDQTSGLVGLSLRGPGSTGTVKKLCAVPFDAKGARNLYLAQTSFAGVRTIIIHHNREPSSAFELFADRSYAEYLWDAILDAGNEFGLQPVGWESSSV